MGRVASRTTSALRTCQELIITLQADVPAVAPVGASAAHFQRRVSRQLIYLMVPAAINDLVGYLTENCCGGAACVPACVPAASGVG